jgi:hypothetical protein
MMHLRHVLVLLDVEGALGAEGRATLKISETWPGHGNQSRHRLQSPPEAEQWSSPKDANRRRLGDRGPAITDTCQLLIGWARKSLEIRKVYNDPVTVLSCNIVVGQVHYGHGN